MDADTRAHSLALVLLAVVLAASVPIGAAAGPHHNGPLDSSQYSLSPNNTTTTTTTAAAPNNSTTGVPSMASQARITPTIPNEDYVGVSVVESDAVFNTTGGFVTFTTSEPVAAARVTQKGASVDVLADGHMLRVQYADDASQPGSATLFTTELFFEDNSTKALQLYARNTGVSASTAINPEWQGLIKHVRENAGDSGYNATPAGGLSYVEQVEDRADLFSGLLSEDFKRYPVLWLANVTNIPMVLTFLGFLLATTYLWKRKFGWILSRQQVSASISAIMRARGRQEYEESRQAAAQHPLAEVEGIGTNASRYWISELGVETIDDMVEIACKGIVATDDTGRVQTDDNGNDVLLTHGVDDLTKVDPVTERTLREETWLKPILVQNRMRAETVLANIEQALQVAEKQYRRGNQVRETRMQVQDLLGELRDIDTGEQTAAIAAGSQSRRVPMGGDD
ncbi:hypothetical protein [Halorubellus sp. PRR65]|uniref:hypothetical protein n=1 Tax=Halorubellus sp. PRR65 TaxID=3098148 RepID=UPI002B25A4BF|nr:hypothetical protein [Halorubellus sp. PRR65]